MMRYKIVPITIVFFLGMMIGPQISNFVQVTTSAQEKPSDGRTPPDILKLAADAKLGT